MQANSITLSVDPANDSNPENQVYSRERVTLNRVDYIGGGHAYDARNQMQLYRTDPKRNGVSRGTGKQAIKFTEDIAVANSNGDGNITLPLIIEASFSIPVGATAAQMMEMRQRLISILDDDTIMAPLNSVGTI